MPSASVQVVDTIYTPGTKFRVGQGTVLYLSRAVDPQGNLPQKKAYLLTTLECGANPDATHHSTVIYGSREDGLLIDEIRFHFDFDNAEMIA